MPAFDTPEAISVTIELQLGDVQVLASDRADTVVVVNPSDRSRPLDVVAAGKTQIEFESPDTDGVCTADLRVFGWEFTLPAEGSDRITTAQINDWAEDRDDLEVEILPAR